MTLIVVQHDVRCSSMLLRVAPASAPCGYPSPAQDYYDGPIDLGEHLIDSPTTVPVVCPSGMELVDAGIREGDVLLVDRSLRARGGDVVVADVDGELVIAQIALRHHQVVLRTSTMTDPYLTVRELSDLTIWGVVKISIHALHGSRTRAFAALTRDVPGEPVDLAGMLVDDQAATFIVRAAGSSMIGAGIEDGDVLLVDRSKHAQDGDVVIAVLDGELTVKRLSVGRNEVTLRAENVSQPDLAVEELADLRIWGVATASIHRVRTP